MSHPKHSPVYVYDGNDCPERTTSTNCYACQSPNCFKCCDTSTSNKVRSPIGILWSLLSIIVAGTCSFSFLQPYWFIEPDTHNSFGMFSYCVSPSNTRSLTHIYKTQSLAQRKSYDLRDFNASPASRGEGVYTCGIYGGTFQFSNLPSNSWQAACVLYGAGCVFLCIAAFLAIMAMWIPRAADKKITLITAHLQSMAVLVMITGLVVYPIGLNSSFVQHYCYGSQTYHSGSCVMGWAYMLSLTGTGLTIFCPFLSHFTDIIQLHDSNTYI